MSTGLSTILSLEDARLTEIVRMLVDDYSRKICLSIIGKSLSIDQISKQQSIPISTCYRRIQELREHGMVRADKTVKGSKKPVRYRATFKAVSISFESGRLEVDMIKNPEEAVVVSTLDTV